MLQKTTPHNHRDLTQSSQVNAGPDAVLHFDGVSHGYKRDAVIVDDLSFSIHAGEILCLLGPSGCGKSTTLRLAAGLEQPLRGSIYLHGQTVATVNACSPAEERDIGLVFQDYALFPHLTVEKNIAFGMHGQTKTDRQHRIKEVLELVGLPDRGKAMPHELSGGQQQRVALARALARRPKLLLLDEPFSGLDARLRDEIRDQTLHILKKAGIAALMVTHDAEEAMFMADRILVMRDGKAEQCGTPETLYYRPRNAFIAGFFGEVNSFLSQVDQGKVHTLFGQLPAGDLPDGQTVQVVIRPEALIMAVPTDREFGCDARVQASRLLGRTSLIHLSAEKEGYAPLHLHARHTGRFLPSDGFVQPLRLDMEQVFIFPHNQKS